MDFSLSIIFMITELALLIIIFFVELIMFLKNKKDEKSGSKKSKGSNIMVLIDIIAVIVTYFSLEAPMPEIYPTNGKISGDGVVSISAPSLVEIYYTLDSYEDPMKNGKKYKGEFKIDKSTTINAKAKFLTKWSQIVYVDVIVDDNGSATGIITDNPGSSIMSIDAYYQGDKLFPGDIMKKDMIKVEGYTINGNTVTLDEFEFSPVKIIEGKNLIKISYNDLETEFEYYSDKPILIEMDAEFIGENIYVDEKLKQEQFRVIGTYEDGKKQKLEDFEIYPSVIAQAGDEKVTISNDGVKTEVNVKIEEKPAPFVVVSELHNPNGYPNPEVTVSLWEENVDYSIDGKTLKNGLKVKFEWLLSSLSGNASDPAEEVESKIYIAVNQDVLATLPEDERFFNGYFVVGAQSNSSVTTANISILADDEIKYESGEITSASTNIEPFHIVADGVNQIVIQIDARVCGNPFYLGITCE